MLTVRVAGVHKLERYDVVAEVVRPRLGLDQYVGVEHRCHHGEQRLQLFEYKGHSVVRSQLEPEWAVSPQKRATM